MKKTKIIFVVVLILWLFMIFSFSSQTNDVSHIQSNRAISILHSINDKFNATDTKVYAVLSEMAENTGITQMYRTKDALVRKSAHIGLYFMLGVICTLIGYLYRKKILLAFLLGISFPVMIAVLDEVNQSFHNRGSALSDVILDGFGAVAGAIFVTLFLLLVVIGRQVKGKLQGK